MAKQSSGIDILLIPEIFIGAIVLLGGAIGFMASSLVTAINNSWQVDDLINKATTLIEGDKYTDGLNYLYKAEKIAPKHATVLFQIGFCRYEINPQDQTAEQYFIKCLDVSPDHNYANLLLGSFYQNAKNFLKSLLYLKRVDLSKLIDDDDRVYALYLFGLDYKATDSNHGLSEVLRKLQASNVESAKEYVSILKGED